MSEVTSDADQVRVLVVDDSAFMRFTITKHLNGVSGIKVVASARDGREALELIPKINPDVVTLDVEMPRMDGLSTLREIMAKFPRPVVMISSLTSEGAVETIRALTLGAVDFIAKPVFKANVASVLDEVAQKVLRASKAKVWSLKSRTRRDLLPKAPGIEKVTRPLSRRDKIVVIGTSTGDQGH